MHACPLLATSRPDAQLSCSATDKALTLILNVLYLLVVYLWRLALCYPSNPDVLEVGGSLVNSAANLVPESVPRGVAKGGVAMFGALVAFWVLQKVSQQDR